MVWCSAYCLLHDGIGDAPRYDWDGVFAVGWDVGEPRKRRSGGGGSVGSGERAWASSLCILAMTSLGSGMRRPVVSSRMIERSVGRGWEMSASAAVRRIDCRATLVFLVNMRRRAAPYFCLR